MTRAGLCVIDIKSNKMITLVRNSPYVGGSTDPRIFVEQYSLPRGRCLGKNEKLQVCALREFVEETRLYFRNITFSKTFCNLYWHDPITLKWEYKIYFAFASFEKKNLIHIERQYNIPMVNTIYIKRKNLKYEPLEPVFIDVSIYIKLLKERLHLYGDNNYMEFMEQLTNITNSKDGPDSINLNSFLFR